MVRSAFLLSSGTKEEGHGDGGALCHCHANQRGIYYYKVQNWLWKEGRRMESKVNEGGGERDRNENGNGKESCGYPVMGGRGNISLSSRERRNASQAKANPSNTIFRHNAQRLRWQPAAAKGCCWSRLAKYHTACRSAANRNGNQYLRCGRQARRATCCW